MELERSRLAHRRASGNARLHFARAPDGQTYLGGQHASYPFHLCRALRFGGDPPGMATVYVQSVSGGIYEDDRLTLELSAEPGTRAHVTTQAASIVHSMTDGWAEQDCRLDARGDALLEYVPDPLILFPAARIQTLLQVSLDETAAVLVCDSFLAHDPDATGRSFDWLRSDTVVTGGRGEVLARERYELEGEVWAQQLPGIGGRFAAQGVLLVLSRTVEAGALAAELRRALDAVGGLYGGASTMPNGCGVAARLLASDGVALRAGLLASWAAARAALTRAVPSPRRK